MYPGMQLPHPDWSVAPEMVTRPQAAKPKSSGKWK